MSHRFAPQRFVKVRVAPRVFRTILVSKSERGVVAGFRVNNDGSHWEHEDATTSTKELVVVREKDVVTELRLNLHYAELEEVK